MRTKLTSYSYDERVLPSIGNEVLKATVAQFDGTSSALPSQSISVSGGSCAFTDSDTASELITNREIVSARIRDDLLNRAKEFNIMLEDVSIVGPSISHDCLSLSHVNTSADQRDIDAHDIR